MTVTNTTRSLIYLNLVDTDGLIDIARNGINPTNLTPLTQQLVQRLAIAIVEPFAPQGKITPTDLEDDNPDNLFEGRVALAVLPLEKLKPLGLATAQPGR